MLLSDSDRPKSFCQIWNLPLAWRCSILNLAFASIIWEYSGTGGSLALCSGIFCLFRCEISISSNKENNVLFWRTSFLERDSNDTMIQTIIHEKLTLAWGFTHLYSNKLEHTVHLDLGGGMGGRGEMPLCRTELHQTLLRSVSLLFAVMITE